MAEKKITKREMFATIKEIVAASDYADKDAVQEFIDKQVELIDNKAAKAKERAEKVKAEGDALRETVRGFLTDEFQTGDAITAAIGDEEITKSKVVARLTQLVKAEIAVKEEVKGEDGKKRMAYKLAPADVDAE
jgi:hypothetical protein